MNVSISMFLMSLLNNDSLPTSLPNLYLAKRFKLLAHYTASSFLRFKRVGDQVVAFSRSSNNIMKSHRLRPRKVRMTKETREGSHQEIQQNVVVIRKKITTGNTTKHRYYIVITSDSQRHAEKNTTGLLLSGTLASLLETTLRKHLQELLDITGLHSKYSRTQKELSVIHQRQE